MFYVIRSYGGHGWGIRWLPSRHRPRWRAFRKEHAARPSDRVKIHATAATLVNTMPSYKGEDRHAEWESDDATSAQNRPRTT